MPFAATDIAGCKLWFKASQIAGANSDPVGSQSDLSGNGYNAAQTTAGKRPLYKTNILNSLPGVLYAPGSLQALGLSGGALDITKNITGLTMFVVVKLANAGSLTDPIGFLTATGGARAVIQSNGTNWQVRGRRLDADGGQNATSSEATTTNAILLTGRWDWTNTTESLYENGILRATKTDFQTSGSTSNTTSTGAWLGADAAASQGDYFDGYIFEGAVYDSALSAANRSLFHSYIQDTYAIAVSDYGAAFSDNLNNELLN